MNSADYLTGDDMINALLADGGSEASTYAHGDTSTDAVLARLRELVIDGEIYPHAVRHTLVNVSILGYADIRPLARLGYVTDRGVNADHLYLTDMGAAFVARVVAEHGCRCAARDHLIRAAHA